MTKETLNNYLRGMMKTIAAVHYPDLQKKLISQIVAHFYFVRKHHELRKKTSMSELLDWIMALTASGIDADELERRIPFLGVLLKTEDDIARFESRR